MSQEVTTEEVKPAARKVILITGGSRGIGGATALWAARCGYAVAISYLSNRKAADAMVRVIKTEKRKAISVQADLGSEKDILRLFDTVENSLGRISAVVNNAGVLEKQMRVDEMDADRLNRIFTTNVTGYFLCCREAVKRMSIRHGGVGGCIVNVSSTAARLGAPGEYIDYAASKAAIDALTIGLSKEVAEEGIRVNAVRPGIIYTDIHVSSGEPGRVDRLKDHVPMKRGGRPEEVARAILWLCSDEASYTTGSFIDVSGGR